MSDKLRIGVLGLTHDHVWSESDAIVACEETELVAAADPNGPLTARFAEQYACPVYSTSDELLESETLDAVYVYGNNFEGAALSIQAMNRGLHALIEKPLASNLEDANRMVGRLERMECGCWLIGLLLGGLNCKRHWRWRKRESWAKSLG